MSVKALLRKTLSVITLGTSTSEGIPCHHCPLHIFVEHEAGGIIHLDKDGFPICARCRILTGAMGSIIKNDKPKRDAQVKAANERVQKLADADALVIAERTQSATGTKRI